jgi:hypothetical protein
MREIIESTKSAGIAITERMAQPEEDAKAKEEVEQPEEDLIESDEQEEAEEAAEESEDEESEDQEETFEILYKGDTLNITQTEAKDLAQKGYDYSQKMSKMSDDIKAQAEKQAKVITDEKTADLEKQRLSLIETTELLEQFIGKPTNTAEQLKAMLDEGDTEGYLRAQEQEKQRQTLIDGAKAERDRVKQQQQQEAQARFEAYSKQQAEILVTKVPELKDKKNLEVLVDYARSVGYTDEELKSAADARALEVLEKARKWDQMISKGVKPKPKSKSPKVTKKAGSNVPKSAQHSKTIQDRQATLSKTGSMRDFGKLYSAKYADKKG